MICLVNDGIFLTLGFFLRCLEVILAVFSAIDGSYLSIDKSAYVKYQIKLPICSYKTFL